MKKKINSQQQKKGKEAEILKKKNINSSISPRSGRDVREVNSEAKKKK